MYTRLKKYLSKLYSLTGEIRTCLAKPCGKPNILILGVYLSDKVNTSEHLALTYQSSKYCRVTQKWACIGSNPKSGLLQNVTALHYSNKVPKFELMNKLMESEDLSKFDYIIFSDDDIYIQNDFIDRYIALHQKFNFSLAQPARTIDSTYDHRIVRQKARYLARETNFVECGPIFSIEKSIYNKMLPFNLTSPMGYGYEYIWPVVLGIGQENGGKMGIIDALPVTHNIRPQASAYKANEEICKMESLLSMNNHLPHSESFKTYKKYLI